MPNIPEKQDKDDSKEIRLFGERSIKEQAYRQKIIQLERDIIKLQSMLENQQRRDTKYDSEQMNRLPEYSEGLFYEAAVSLDERAKRHQYMLESKAREISDRLNLQAQNLIEHEKIHSHVITTKKVLIILSLFTIVALALGAFSIFTLLKLTDSTQKSSDTYALYEDPQNIKGLLQKSGFYNNQYTIVSLNYYNKMYKGTVELHFRPHNKWTLKMAASDIIENFKRISLGRSIELNFIYENDTYAKVSFSSILNQIHYEFIK